MLPTNLLPNVCQDCFFASVAEAAYPVLRGKPLAVSHSASAQGSGEVSRMDVCRGIVGRTRKR